jgi:hypothetical protein
MPGIGFSFYLYVSGPGPTDAIVETMRRSNFRNVVAVAVALSVRPAILAQGLVNFYNDATTPVYTQLIGGPTSIMSGPRDSFYFGLLIGDPLNGVNWTFTGLYGTNTGVNGLFSGGTVAVPGWLAGTTTNFLVAGWSSDLGHDYDPFLLLTGRGYFGTVNGFGVAGNESTVPTLNLFNGDPGTISGNGFVLLTSVPEPSSASLIAVGAGMWLLLRRKRAMAGHSPEPVPKQ